MSPRSIFLSWDFLAPLAISLGACYLLPNSVDNAFSANMYNVGISVLSIVFSVYFAALAIIISSSDDDFVYFLEEVGDYSRIIFAFRFTLALLFGALIFSIILYATTSFLVSQEVEAQPKYFLGVFGFFFFYSLFAAANTTLDALRYAKTRSVFLKIKQGDQSTQSNTTGNK